MAVDYNLLYQFLPDVVKINDPDGAVKAYLEGVSGMHAYYQDLIDGLPDLVNPEMCPPEFLPELASLVGVEVPYQLPTEIKRLLIARAVATYKVKGTHLSFRILMRSLGLDGAVLELWTNWDMNQFKYTSDVAPVVGGVENPFYDPANITDGLVKYKSSFWDLQVFQIAPTVPPSIINILLDKIETIRPLTRTLRKVFFMIDTVDEWPVDTTDEVKEAGTWESWDRTFTQCYYYSCSLAPYYSYDGSLGDYSNPINPKYDFKPAACDLFYDNGVSTFYDGVAILDYTGLNDPAGSPFLYNGWGATDIRYDCGGDRDELTWTSFYEFGELDHFPGRGVIYYDNDPMQSDPVTYANTYGFDYSGQQGVYDDIEVLFVKDLYTDTFDPATDEILVSYGISFEDFYGDMAYYDGEFLYEGNISYGGNSVPDYIAEEGVYSQEDTFPPLMYSGHFLLYDNQTIYYNSQLGGIYGSGATYGHVAYGRYGEVLPFFEIYNGARAPIWDELRITLVKDLAADAITPLADEVTISYAITVDDMLPTTDSFIGEAVCESEDLTPPVTYAGYFLWYNTSDHTYDGSAGMYSSEVTYGYLIIDRTYAGAYDPAWDELEIVMTGSGSGFWDSGLFWDTPGLLWDSGGSVIIVV